jgi:hypothetical protein
MVKLRHQIMQNSIFNFIKEYMKLSIIIPFYNVEKYIVQSLNSLFFKPNSIAWSENDNNLEKSNI